MFKKITAAACTLLLVSCVNTSLENAPGSELPTPMPSPELPMPDVEITPLPETIATLVRTAYAQAQGISEDQVQIFRYSRETWNDGCLGLGGPAESCSLALTEGWQVEATDTGGTGSSFYRTDLTGEQIRLSTLENNLPPSVSDRILQTLQASGMTQSDNLSIVAAEPQIWDGCYGVAEAEDICAQIAIFGWRAIATDTQSYWTYHTDNLGNTIVLNENATSDEPPISSELEINDFSLEEALTQVDRGCSILLKRTLEDANYILHEGYLEDGLATMKIEGNWVQFIPDQPVVGINEPVRTFVSEDGQKSLTVETPAGDRIGQELIEIPNATITIQTGDLLETKLSAVGEAGC